MKAYLLLAATALSIPFTSATAQQQMADAVEAEDNGEILVTAQRRSERLADVPISITALSEDALASAGVRSTEDLSSVTPGLNFATNGAFAQPTIRGIGTTVSSAGNDANVAMYVDGVYQPNQIGNFADLVDIEQVEVLKGPQGTLFGRNATGGAIRVTTRRPSYTPTAILGASYGRFDEVTLNAYGSTGITSNLAASVAYAYGDDEGYTRNIGTGNRVSTSNRWSLRGKLMFEPSDAFRATLSASHAERDSNAAFSLGILNGNSSSITRPGVIRATGPREVSLTFDPYITVNQDSASLTAEMDLGFAELTSITSYQSTQTNLATDVDRTNLALTRADIPGDQTTWTQELNLVSQGNGPLKWFLGAFYYNDDASAASIINNGAVFNTAFLKTEAIAPFGEINLTLGDLTLIGGLRYNSEQKDFTLTRGAAIERRSRTYNTLTPRLGARFAVSPQSNIYATWSRGFKSGTFDGILAGANLVVSPVLPEEVDAFEIGYKYGRGSTNFSVSGFYYDYSNIQFQAFNPNAGGLTQVFNAASAEIYGAEAELSIELTEEFNLRASLAYTHSEYSSFPTASILCPNGAPNFGNRTIAIGATNPCTGQVNSDGATGNELIRTPEFTASVSGAYRHELASGAAVDASASAFYSGSFFWDPGNRLREPSYVLVNAELGYSFAGTPLRVALWGRNLLNETYSLYVTESAGGDSVAYARPRSYGISARVTF
jgi:iron complex outermembrane receptor protein